MLRIPLPNGWNDLRLKDAVKFRADSLPENTSPDYRFRYVDIGSVEYGTGITKYQEMAFSEAPSRARKRVQEGDTIVSTVRTYLKAIAYVSDAEDVIASTGFSVLCPRAVLLPRYLTYLMESDLVCDEIAKLSWGVSYPAISESLMGNIHVPIPPLSEQQRITEELDSGLKATDKVAYDLEQQLITLSSYRASVIHEAVTKGLDPSIPMKPSGVEWIGNVPVTWDVRRVSHLCRLESGHTPSKDHPEWWIDEQCTIPWITTGDVHRFRDGRLTEIIDTEEHISEIGLANSSARLLPAGTVALSRTASVGFSIVLGTEMASSQDFADWVPGTNVNSKYLLYVFRSMGQQFEQMKLGSTHKTIYMHVLKTLKMPLPSVDEQSAIVSYIEGRTTAIDAVIDTKRKQLEILKRRRQSLIYEYVTGKRRVGEEA